MQVASADGEQNESPQQVPEVLEELVPAASNEASMSPLAVPLEDSATSSHQDSSAEASSPDTTETSNHLSDSSVEDLSKSIILKTASQVFRIRES